MQSANHNLETKASIIRYGLFPLKILAFISILITPIFFILSTLTNVFDKFKNIFWLKIGIFLSFALINVIIKILNAITIYRETEYTYVKNNFNLKIPVQTNKTNKDGKPIYNFETQNMDHLKFFQSKDKKKYFGLVSIGVTVSALFIVPYILLECLEYFEIVNCEKLLPYHFFSNLFYTLCLTTLLITFIATNLINICTALQKKSWVALDNSQNNQIPMICTIACAHQMIESIIAYKFLYNKFMGKYYSKRNGEIDKEEQISTIMIKRFILSNCLSFSVGTNTAELFGLTLPHKQYEKAKNQSEICCNPSKIKLCCAKEQINQDPRSKN